MSSAVQANPYAGYQIVVAVDISGSMNKKEEDYGWQSRFAFVQDQIGYLAADLATFDEDGIDVITFNHDVKLTRNVDSPKAVKELFANNRAGGSTNTTGAVKQAYELHKEYRKDPNFKSTLVLVITDGKPNDPGKLESELVRISQKVKHHAAIGFTFLQVGNDKGAEQYLQHLDDMKVQNDIVDRKSFTDLMEGEKLSLAKVLADCLND